MINNMFTLLFSYNLCVFYFYFYHFSIAFYGQLREQK